jgi:predicted homoserine dehydrogenase-like protein
LAESDEIRVGLIGSGLLGAIHAAGLAAIPGCRLVAATAPLPGAADVAVRDGDAICDPALVDAVIVATPRPRPRRRTGWR